MTPFRIGRSARALILTSTAFVALASFAQNAQAATAAGTVIRNQATATYKDGSGNNYQAQSNVAEITVQKVYEATLGHDREKSGSAGQTIYSSHTLSNLGNSEAYYKINVYDADSSVSVADSTQQGFLSPLVATRVYHDLNGNGVADAGEPVLATWNGVGTNSVIRIEAGKDAQLIIAAQLPTNAVSGNRFGAGIYVQPVGADGTTTATGEYGAVKDVTRPNERHDLSEDDAAHVGSVLGDQAIALNNLLINVTANAVLDVTKEATLDAANQRIHYVVTVRNVGGRPAQQVRIFDVIPTGTTLVPGSIQSRGFGTLFGDAAGDAVDLDETADDYDYDRDGLKTSTAVKAIEGLDHTIAPGTTVQLAFSVSYNPTVFPIGAKITNVAFAHADLDEDPNDGNPATNPNGRDGVPQPSNEANITIGSALYGVTIADTATGAGPANDGGDDDGDPVNNDVQEVNSVPPGSTVIFRNVITNNGTTADRFNLTLPDGIGSFPPGTHIAFWNEGGAVLLLDTDGDGIPNTPIIPALTSYTIEVRATLPQSVSGGGPYAFTVRATSGLAPPLPLVSDTVVNRLLSISAPKVDLVNTIPSSWDPANNVEAYNMDLGTPAVPTTTRNISPGQTASFQLALQNQGKSPDSFQLYAGGRWYNDTTADPLARLRPLEDGWSVRFYGPNNVEISTTPTLKPDDVYSFTAVVQAPTNAWQAQIDYLEDVRANSLTGDGTDDLIGSNAYPFFFMTHSRISGAFDVKLDAVKILPTPKFSLSANKEEQTILPGGYSRTSHTLRNTGNIAGDYEFTVVNPDPDWAATIWLDTNGDGQPDKLITALTPGATVTARDPSGALTTVVFNGAGFDLPPGYEIPVWLDVYAPADAAPNDVNIPVLTARDLDVPSSTQTARIPYRVTMGVLRLVKTAAHDPSCDHTPDSVFTEFASRVAPEECAIWQVVGSNVGTQPVNTVNLTDAVPDFTRFVANSVRFCAEDAGLGLTAACSFTSVLDSALTPAPVSGLGNIGLSLGTAVGPTHIPAGGSFTVRFMTVVD